MNEPRVLLVDDQPDVLAAHVKLLQRDGYRVTLAADGESALRLAAEELPDVIILDVDMPVMDGFEVVRRLRALRRTALLPVLFLSGHGEAPRKVKGLELGADDFILKPVDYSELKARIGAALARAQRSLGANPLTGLPGNTAIEIEVTRRIREGAAFALSYVDIDFFKSYNDAYGFAKGDDVIRAVGRLLLESVSKEGTPEDFVGHIGGDDFVLVTSLESLEAVVDHALKAFDRLAPDFYNDEDRKRGGIVAADRMGRATSFPVLRLSIGAATTGKRRFKSYGEAAGVASEMKKFAKARQRQGSYFAKDRRTD
jgi:diguanylate cyclase (GGDEF)-like protein